MADLYTIKILYYNFSNAEKLLQIQHLKMHILSGVKDTLLNRDINKKLKKQYYRDKLVLIAALPKSASTVIGDCVACILSQKKDFRRGYASYMLNNQTSNLRPELVKDFPEGGVLKYHTHATGGNLSVLELLGISYLILFRHPADQIAALYCHIQRELKTKRAFPFTENLNIYVDHIYPIEKQYLKPDVEQAKFLEYLINQGYLFESLRFMTNWLRFRSVDKSLVVTYEEYIISPVSLFKKIGQFLTEGDIPDDTLNMLRELGNNYLKIRECEVSKYYKKGYTGKIGVWKDYFSEENKHDYVKVVESFLKTYPEATRLLDIYPDIADIH